MEIAKGRQLKVEGATEIPPHWLQLKNLYTPRLIPPPPFNSSPSYYILSAMHMELVGDGWVA